MRLDKYLIENNYFSSRNRAQNEIKNGNILIDDKPIKNPNFDYKNGVIKMFLLVKFELLHMMNLKI